MELLFLVNSGVCLMERGQGILIDGIHCGERAGFSPVPPMFWRALEEPGGLRAKLNGLLFTHAHADHFDREKLSRLRAVGPMPPVWCPGEESDADCRPFLPGTTQVLLDSCMVLAVDTVHAGADFAHTPHQSYLIRRNGDWVFVAGDAQLGEAEGRKICGLCGGKAVVALVNPMQLLDPGGAAFLRALLPRRVLLYHLPLPAEDRLGCWAMARQAAVRYPQDLPALELLEPMSKLQIETGENSVSERSGITCDAM